MMKQSGVFSSEDFTTYLKTKLTNIEENAQRNVQSDWEQSDTSADDFIKNKPDFPDKMNEIYDKTVSNIKYSKYTGAELYSSFLAGRLYCYDGHIIIGMSVVDSNSYYVYYFAGGAITIESDYNCSLRRITLDNNKVLSNDAYSYRQCKNYGNGEHYIVSGVINDWNGGKQCGNRRRECGNRRFCRARNRCFVGVGERHDIN